MRCFYCYWLLLLALLASRPAAAQTTPAFAKGADISWVTELEANNYKFYNRAGAQQDLFPLLKNDYALNTIRLRVWVNPPGGYNNAADVLAKARRAQALGDATCAQPDSAPSATTAGTPACAAGRLRRCGENRRRGTSPVC